MGQVLMRHLDDAVIADYLDAAARKGRSLEAELRTLVVVNLIAKLAGHPLSTQVGALTMAVS